MPEDDDGLVPPLKIMRKRLNGVYSAEGFRAPTRRYVLLVALLVALASVPTLAAITAGSHSLEDGTVGAMDTPLLPPPSAGPVQPPAASALPSASSGSGSAPSSGLSPSTPDGGGEAAVQGQAGKRSTKPKPSRADSGVGGYEPDGSQHGHSPSSDSPASPVVPSRPGKPAGPGGSNPGDSAGSDPDGSGSEGSGSDGPGSDGHGSDGSGSSGSGSDGSSSDGSGSDGSGSEWSGFGEWRSGEWGSDRSGSDGSEGDGSEGDGSEGDGSEGDGSQGDGSQGDGSEADGSGSYGSGARAEPEDPDDPGQQPPTGQPWCNDLADCSSRPSHHYRPDWSRHRHCGESTHKARYSHHREGRARSVIVHVGWSGRHAQPVTIREDAHRPGAKQLVRSLVSHRSDSTDRSSSRRSEVIERPENLRLARSPERTHNSHRSQYSTDHADGQQAASHSYRGSHRAERLHSTDDQRSSRVGRHHADRHRDHSDRW